MDAIDKIGVPSEFEVPGLGSKATSDAGARGFAEALEQAVDSVDQMQKESEAAQQAYANHEPVELHEVLIKIEEAEVAFKTMMEVRNKLVESYREIMRMA